MDRQTIKNLPKGEFHLHLEGSVPWELLRQRDPERFGKPPTSWDRDFRFRNFAHFDQTLLDAAGVWFKKPEDYYTVAREVFREQQENHVVYSEVSIASGCLEFSGITLDEALDAVKSAAPEDLTVRVFLGIHHNGYTALSGPMIENALTTTGLDGFDLHGTETIPLEPWTERIWTEARQAGKFTKAHAGEFDGPQFIRHAVETLGVTRIEHGVRAVEDPGVMDLLREKGVTLDICPVSNLKLGVCPSLREHPLPRLVRSGINCTISRDDPFCFGSTLDEEYFLIQEECGLTDNETVSVIAAGFRTALVPEKQKELWLADLIRIQGKKG